MLSLKHNSDFLRLGILIFINQVEKNIYLELMNVIKRDGTSQEYSFIKISNAVKRAFKAFGKEVSPELLLKLSKINIRENIPVEEIQDMIEDYLMDVDKEVAKAFILYREQHKQARIISKKLGYIHKYIESNESATNLSNTDDNANANLKNVVTLEGELYKDTNRIIQRNEMKEYLSDIHSKYRDQYINDLEKHYIYQHDEVGLLKPYCSAYTLYPLLVDGTNTVDGTKNKAPKHLSSFVGQFQNLVFLLSAQKKGAGAYGEFFNFFSYFCEKEWGLDYWKRADEVITTPGCLHQMTIGSTIDQYFQSVTHYINQPAGNRGYQSPFTNFNVFDRYYWHNMFDDFVFPDGSHPNWDAVNWLQKRYMQWLNNERSKTLLTFPVMTVCMLTDDEKPLDEEYEEFATEQWALGDSFFAYLSKNADSIASCCRLRNEITENTFSSTTGLTGVQTGSCNVMTLNLARIIQDHWREMTGTCPTEPVKVEYFYKWKESFKPFIEHILDRVYDYQRAYKTGLYKLDKQGMLPQTRAGYISLDKLYCTIGVNGINEAGQFLGYPVTNNPDYMQFCTFVLRTIKDYNAEHSTKKFKFNLELVPAESLGVKNYNWDKSDGYWVPTDVNLYNSYIYDAHNPNVSILDKIAMQGGEIAKSIDGGQASHLNLEENLSKEQYKKLLRYAIKCGNSYITYNIPQTQCDDCGFIAKHPFDKCPNCGSEHVTQWTRIIGYLRPVKAWSAARQIEVHNRYFAKKEFADK